MVTGSHFPSKHRYVEIFIMCDLVVPIKSDCCHTYESQSLSAVMKRCVGYSLRTNLGTSQQCFGNLVDVTARCIFVVRQSKFAHNSEKQQPAKLRHPKTKTLTLGCKMLSTKPLYG